MQIGSDDLSEDRLMTSALSPSEMSPPILGVGLYTPDEAAFYARVGTKMLNRWVFGTGGLAVFDPVINRDEKLITFPELIQAMSVRSIRWAKDVSLQKIRDGVKRAQDEFGVDYPLATKHKVFIFGSEIVINIGDDLSKRYMLLTGKYKNNLLIQHVAELFMKDIAFDESTGIANRFTALKQSELEVRLDPKIRFGEAMIPSCGYSAQALWDAYRNEGGIEEAAQAYDVRAEEIELACRFYDQYLPKSAA